MAAANYQIGTVEIKDTLAGKQYMAKFFVIPGSYDTYTKEIGNSLNGVGDFPDDLHCVQCIPGPAGVEGRVITLVGREANFAE